MVRGLIKETTAVDLKDQWSGSEELGSDELALSRRGFASTLQSWTLVSDRDHHPVLDKPVRVTTTDRGGRIWTGQRPSDERTTGSTRRVLDT